MTTSDQKLTQQGITRMTSVSFEVYQMPGRFLRPDQNPGGLFHRQNAYSRQYSLCCIHSSTPDRTITVGPGLESGRQMVLDFNVSIYLHRLVQFTGALMVLSMHEFLQQATTLERITS